MLRSKCRPALLTLAATLALGALTAAPALASGKPFVETKPATSIGETTATLHGVVNPNSAETKYWFEYGTTTSYGTKTAEASAGSGATNIEESKAITGLTAGTTYHFRVVAKNVNGTTDGADEVFSTTTKPALPEFVPKAGSKGETFPLSVEGKYTGAIDFNQEVLDPLQCDGGNFTYSITAAKTVSMTDTFTECRGHESMESCSTTDESNNGTVVVTGTGTLVYLNKTTKQVGIALALNKTMIYCIDGAEEVFRGTLISPITPINTETTKPEMQYHQKSIGVEEFTEYENEKGEKVKTSFTINLDGVGFNPASLEMPGKLLLTSARGLTIKS